jgi:uncharacterized protein (TIGR02145 family)
MKKNLLLMMMCVPLVLAAQNGVTVSNLAVDAGTVTFNVSWKNTGMPTLWSDTVWVFVDYNKNGKMERLPLSPGATLTATSAPGVGKVREEPEPGNNQGVWVTGNARNAGSFSATVQLLTTVNSVGGACVYASNYPPVGEYIEDGIKFTGTAPYTVVLEDSEGKATTYTVDSPFPVPGGCTVKSFTDKTGMPGIINCKSPVAQQLVVSSPAYCEGSGVTFALANTETGAIYQLYAAGVPLDGATLTGGGSPATFSGSFEAGTYSAQTVPGGGFCLAVMKGTHTVSENPVPTISRVDTRGAASQSVKPNTAITAIVYTATNSATISRTGGNFPAGVSGTATGSSFTISGTPTQAGTFGYSLTAATGSCTSSAATGTLTVLSAPPGAASTYIWGIGSQFWSAPLQKAQAGCTAAIDLGEASPPPVAYYRTSDLYNGSGYLYNWKCVNDYAAQLCPSPWRVPTRDDFVALDKAFGGNGENRDGVDPKWIEAAYMLLWGGVCGGTNDVATIYGRGTYAWYWSGTQVGASVNILQISLGGMVRPAGTYGPRGAVQVRCVH